MFLELFKYINIYYRLTDTFYFLGSKFRRACTKSVRLFAFPIWMLSWMSPVCSMVVCFSFDSSNCWIESVGIVRQTSSDRTSITTSFFVDKSKMQLGYLFTIKETKLFLITGYFCELVANEPATKVANSSSRRDKNLRRSLDQLGAVINAAFLPRLWSISTQYSEEKEIPYFG